jgi:hypothetical protein
MKWHNQRAVWRRKAGQAMVEYVVLTGLTLGVLILLSVFLYAFKEAGGRVLDLIAYEYP